jgi:hypothetical protein
MFHLEVTCIYYNNIEIVIIHLLCMFTYVSLYDNYYEAVMLIYFLVCISYT